MKFNIASRLLLSLVFTFSLTSCAVDIYEGGRSRVSSNGGGGHYNPAPTYGGGSPGYTAPGYVQPQHYGGGRQHYRINPDQAGGGTHPVPPGTPLQGVTTWETSPYNPRNQGTPNYSVPTVPH